MPRTARTHAEGHWYHVFNRGARRWPIFRDDADRHSFLAIVADMAGDHGVEVHAYCLMTNHHHLVLRCPQNNLGAAMKQLGQRHTQHFNRRHGTDGPLFRGRFGSVPVTSDEQLLTVVRYVVRNPLDIGGIDDPEEYVWSSHRAYVGIARPPSWLQMAVLVGLHGGVDRYESFVAEVPVDARAPEPSDRVVRNVVETAADVVGRSGRADARSLAALALVELFGRSSTDVAEVCGWARPASARSAILRARRKRATDAAFASSWEAMKRLVQPATDATGGVRPRPLHARPGWPETA